ncbi:hypothetical protein [Streptomyces sp. SA15]|uniref:hypothetical protein n=1 Tax=Streptomyces sp. SA15 TaxID=934019 RepID=UPI0015CCCE49|nr:hypothetical protein [Streptomyces sp. SA15]
MKHDPENGLIAAGSLGMPEATGSRRMAWAAMPREVTAEIERLLGSPVAEAISQHRPERQLPAGHVLRQAAAVAPVSRRSITAVIAQYTRDSELRGSCS